MSKLSVSSRCYSRIVILMGSRYLDQRLMDDLCVFCECVVLEKLCSQYKLIPQRGVATIVWLHVWKPRTCRIDAICIRAHGNIHICQLKMLCMCAYVNILNLSTIYFSSIYVLTCREHSGRQSSLVYFFTLALPISFHSLFYPSFFFFVVVVFNFILSFILYPFTVISPRNSLSIPYRPF